MPHQYQYNDVVRSKRGPDHVIHLVNQRKALVTVVPDEEYPNIMWRVVKEDGTLSDRLNLTRAVDAAKVLAVRILNAPSRAIGGHPG